MVATRRKRVKGEGGATATNENANEVTGAGSGYEQFRDLRIKENKERMQKLGIFDLSLKLKSHPGPPKKTPRSVSSDKKPHHPLPLFASPRRSSRLKSMSPVSYSELKTKTKRESSKNEQIQLREGSNPEIYTEEHKKLLGDCKTTWTLLVDGYDKNGKRIYDQENGETCHQCRQKTLGLHTHCRKCNLVQGQFCGDCLYMRYGENVIEVNQNPKWICPACRGICNCSFCRQAKGWAPTGNLYRKVIKLGFKSVAHYLIQARCFQTCLEDSGAESLASEEGALTSVDKVSQPSSHNNADEHPDGFYDPQADYHQEETEGQEKQPPYSDSSKHAYVGVYDDDNDPDTVGNYNGLKEEKGNIVVQEGNDKKL